MSVSINGIKPTPFSVKLGEKVTLECGITVENRPPSGEPTKPKPGSAVIVLGVNGEKTKYYDVGKDGELIEWEHYADIKGNFDQAGMLIKGHRDPIEYRYNRVSQENNTAMSKANDETWERVQETVDRYISGDAGLSEVEQVFRECAVKNLEDNIANGYACLDDPGEMQKALEQFYTDFRRTVIGTALKANNAEGNEKYPHHNDGFRYYNSEYHYKTQDAIDAITTALNEVARSKDLGEIEIPTYEKMYLYQNFTAAWGNPFVLGSVNSSGIEIPPRDFVLAYQPEVDLGRLEIQIGDQKRTGIARFKAGIYGTVNALRLFEKSVFAKEPQLELFLSTLSLHNEHWHWSSVKGNLPFLART